MNIDVLIKIQVLRPQDIDKFYELITVFEKVFDMESFTRPNEAHLLKLLGEDEFIAVIALNNNKVIGGLTVYTLHQYYSEKPLAYIYDVAVLTEYQRKGIGKKLIEFTRELCRQKGFEELFVQADKVDDYAIDFYRLTTPTSEEQMVHFSYKL
ncbi:MAG TPA: GNAT family N-acetyltransferase [Saprospiraceae bacterium]|nr:GNAT family N-acetyltransferase [Saprospiraceae bacterium]